MTYRPPADPSGFDPVRIGMLVFLVAGTAAFALATIGSILAWRADPEPFGLLVLGILWSMVPALREGIRRRDPLPLLELALLAGLVILIRSRRDRECRCLEVT